MKISPIVTEKKAVLANVEVVFELTAGDIILVRGIGRILPLVWPCILILHRCTFCTPIYSSIFKKQKLYKHSLYQFIHI